MTELYRRVTTILKENGYTRYRQAKGSHELWCKNGQDCVTVPVTLKSRHTANSILKEVGIGKKI